MEDCNSVEWRDIPGYEGYYRVSNDGRVYSIRRGAELKPHPVGDGRLVVTLMVDRKRKNYKVHHLVVLAFVGPRPDGCETHHKNDNFLDNRLDNLEYLPDDKHRELHYMLRKQKGYQRKPYRKTEYQFDINDVINGLIEKSKALGSIRKLAQANGFETKKLRMVIERQRKPTKRMVLLSGEELILKTHKRLVKR